MTTQQAINECCAWLRDRGCERRARDKKIGQDTILAITKKNEITQANHSKAPPYGKQLKRARDQGYTLRTSLAVALSWDLAHGWPRIVVPRDFDVVAGDFSMVRGIDCLIVHRDEPGRALAVAAAVLSAGAVLAPIIDVWNSRTIYTSDVLEAMRDAA